MREQPVGNFRGEGRKVAPQRREEDNSPSAGGLLILFVSLRSNAVALCLGVFLPAWQNISTAGQGLDHQ